MGPKGEPGGERSERDKREELERIAREQQDAVWGADEAPDPGGKGRLNVSVISGDVGVKNRIAGDLRAISLASMRRGDRVPSGTTTGRGGLVLLGTMLLLVLGALVLLAAIIWLAA